jgi:hypothetical protein
VGVGRPSRLLARLGHPGDDVGRQELGRRHLRSRGGQNQDRTPENIQRGLETGELPPASTLRALASDRCGCSTRVNSASDTAFALGIIVTELVTNAVKYAFPPPRSGTIFAQARRGDPDRLEVSIKDDGIGMASFREESLGYGLVRSLVEQISGTIAVQSDPGFSIAARHEATDMTTLLDQRKSFYIAVGQGISYWASMEERLVQVAARLLNTTEAKAGLVMYSIMSPHTWITIIDELFALDGSYPKSMTKWKAIAKSLREEIDNRNKLAHHALAQEEDGAGWTRAYLRASKLDFRTKTKKFTPMTEDEIVAFTLRLGDTHDQLIRLLEIMKKRRPLR